MDTSATAQVASSPPKQGKGGKTKKKKVKQASSTQPEEAPVPVTVPPQVSAGQDPPAPAEATKSQVFDKSKKKKKKTKSKSKKKSKKRRSKSRKRQDEVEKDSTIANESIAGEDPEEELEEEEQESLENARSQQLTSGKPQVWIRLRPNATPDDNAFEVTQDGKGIQMTRCQPEKNGTTKDLNTKSSGTESRRSTKEPRKQKQQGSKPNFAASNPLPFSCDGVLKNVNQDQVYGAIADDLVVKAMDGVSGLILSVGTKASGKSFTLFGSLNKFQHRGLVPRCLERIFQICATKADQIKYQIGIAIHEIRDNKILDLLTLQPQDQPATAPTSLDGDGCNGGAWHQMWSAEHGFGLLIRAITCQKEIPRESWAKPHTLVLIDIHGEACTELHKPSNVIKSRITFVKFGAIPERENPIGRPPSPKCRSASPGFNHLNGSGCPDKPGMETIDDSFPQHPCDGGICCGRRRRNGPLAEAIGLRQDLGFLQRMCSQAGKDYRLRSSFSKQLRKAGITTTGTTMEPLPRLDHHFRMSKLTYCLKDIINGRTEIRILLHLRPEWSYWRYNLEILRFGNQVKFVPYGLSPADSNKFQPRSTNILEQFLTGIPPNVADVFIRASVDCSGNSPAFTQNNMNGNNNNFGIAYSDRHFKTSHGLTDDQVQELFRIFRSLWASALETGKVSLDHFRSSEADRASTAVVSDAVAAPATGTAPNADGTSSPETTLVDPKGKSASGSTSAFGARSSNYPTESFMDKKDQEEDATVAPKTGVDAMMDVYRSEYKKHEEGGEGGLDPCTDSYFHYSLQGHDHDEEAGGENISKKEAWTKFAASEAGSQLLERLRNQRKQLAQIAREHEDAISETSVTLSRLTNLQAELNLIQQKRFLAGDKYDAATGNVLIGPRERQVIQAIKTLEESKNSQAARLDQFKSALFTAKQEMDAIKRELDATFLRFSKGYPTPNDLVDSQQELAEPSFFCGDGTQVRSHSEDLDQSKKFEQVRKVAEKQAKGYFKAAKAVYRPPWVSY